MTSVAAGSKWLDIAARVLGEPDAAAAESLLAGALMHEFDAHFAVRVVTGVGAAGSGAARSVQRYGMHHCAGRAGASATEVRAFPTPPPAPPDLWQQAVDTADTGHPLFAHHAMSGSLQPTTLSDVTRYRRALSPRGRELIADLGMTLHQLSMPTRRRPGTAVEAFGFVSESPYHAEAVAAAVALQPLIAGLAGHIDVLNQLAGPDVGGQQDAALARPLTPREMVVLRLVARGSTVTGIAATLNISPRTVHKHQENLYRKIGAVDRLSAVLAAQRHGLLPAPESAVRLSVSSAPVAPDQQ